VMACVTGPDKLDPQAVRARLQGNWRRLSFATAGEIEQITGSVQGAVSPIGLPKEVPVVFDEAILKHERVNISSGDPMAGLELDVQSLVYLAQAKSALIAVKVEV